ncbi:peptidyl-prolyl cis-trans isomerase [Belliella aquatica]|uniref:Peptidyl-prolyl cis-trans isomerase n=1 Tax=Belliella aquatica TaxID=1323734 RepID=A0ABQ1N5Q2_9BACT|nr:peptidyl-prolyl cis-trans isomerase [Belliella aquatica]MCH7407547.1 peptidyl-prolyl cis-trans isomerase [Belliella aquatica]GGC54696.1 hypothetical protein GCM10010993_36350 [Belliella aquatica]
MKKEESTILSLTNKLYLPILVSILLSSCDFFKFKSENNDLDENPIVASVGNQLLRNSDVAFLVTTGSSKEDSTNLTNRYVQSWVRKQLMILEAGKNMTFDEAELNRKLLDYKYALMVYEFEKSYVTSNSSAEISNAEIEEYYENNKESFSLKEIIVRTNFFKLEKSNPQNRPLERLLTLNRDNVETSIRQIALDHASNYYMEDSTWVRFEDVIVNTPLAANNNKVELLRNSKLIKVDDEIYSYYFKILDYKLQDQIPPLDFVREEISKILTNKKRVALVEQLQKDIYNRALENNEFKIYD